ARRREHRQGAGSRRGRPVTEAHGTPRPILYERLGTDGLCPSPVCWRARIALAVKGVEAERRALRFGDVEPLARISGTRTVPVRAPGAATSAGSAALDAHPDAARPDGPRLTGDTAAFGAELDRELAVRIGPLVSSNFRRRRLREDRDYYAESRQARYGRS